MCVNPHPQELDNNEAVVCMALAELAPPPGAGGQQGQGTELHLVVGCAKGLRYMPTDCEGECGGRGDEGLARVSPAVSL